MARTPTRAVHAAVLVAAAAVLLLPLSSAGIAPFELDAADHARRIAVHHLGAGALLLDGDPAAAPTLGDLGMGELPFTAMALAFRGLGLRAWVGRLTFALFGLVAVIAVHGLCARFAGRRVGLFVTAVLLTSPLFVLHARAMVGDGASIACFAAAWVGLAGAQLEPRRRCAAAWLGLGALGLFGGFACRGALLGVASPLCSAGLAGVASGWLLPRHEQRTRTALGLGMIAAAAIAGVAFVLRAAPVAAVRGDEVLRTVGMTLQGAPPGEATFDRIVRQIGHAAFPWSAVAPFAVGRLLGGSPAGRPGAARPGADGPGVAGVALRLHALSAVLVSVVTATAVVPWSGDIPWLGISALAVVLGLALDDLAEGSTPGAIGALFVLTLGAVLTLDLIRVPERTLAAFSLDAAAFPPGMGARATAWIAMAAVGCLAPLALVIAAPVSSGERSWKGRVGAVRDAGRDLLAAWQGWLVFALVVAFAALVGLAAMVLVGGWLEWSTVLRLSRPTARAFLHAFWIVPALCAVGPLAAMLGHAALSAVARALGATRTTVALGVAAGAALAFSLGFHGEVAGRLSPRDALDAYRERRSPGELLGVVAFGARLALFHGGDPVASFDAPPDAFSWFDGEADARRWLVVPARDLPELNALHRARSGTNVPISVATGEALLAVSDLRGEPSANPLDAVVLDVPPRPARPVVASLDDKVDVLGWEVRDHDGELVEAVSAGTPYRALFFVRSVAPLPSGFRPFLHVERAKLRWNGDEAFVDEGYPAALWHTGDVVVLACELELDTHFRPGDHEVHFGFFSGGERLPVTRGPASGDRVHMGQLQVR